ncbi:phage tail protein (plasmid) [Pseudomonas corrugata]|uniref:phage tail-collar fiber domain-containing protein n=1 Tax=Pseudomonas corrugata TaxID=47879 RepID=UPI00222E0ED5|nr:phage tail protein [Pseudomonas corrugata]UZD98480.1 phage tail protein [Pseudomonas corrugata]UZD98515.1 phage tail protein [Pseudomonas corrugata]
MADFYTLLTNAGIAYENACKAAGQPIKLTQISVGDGNGAVYNPAATATALKREVWRGPLNALFQDEQNPSWLLAEVTIPPEEGGFYVREAGIWTDTGILYAIVKYPESFKPVLASSGSGKEFYIRAIFETSNASSVTLLIDDTVVKATRAWVMSYLVDELAKLDSKQSVRVAATGNVVLSGAQQIDDVAVTSGQRVLLPLQTQAKDNGIWIVANGAWVRAADANTSAKVTPNLTVMVEEGTANGDSLWHLVTNGPITLGTTALAFEMLAGKTGIQPGAYKSVTVDKYGRVISGTNPTTLAGYGITDTYTKAEVEALIAQASALPVGSMVAFPVNKLAPGFLEIDGSVKSIAAYPDLAAFLGTTFNQGNEGAGNFRLPESRGEFLRGWDHGRGADAGRAIGSWQKGSIHSFDMGAGIGIVGDRSNIIPSTGDNARADLGYDAGLLSDYPSGQMMSTASGQYSWLGDTTEAASGVTRPRNLAVMWCIKAWAAPANQGNIDVAALAAQAENAQKVAVVGSHKNLSVSATGLSALVSVTADQLVVGSETAFKTLSAVNISINAASVGANGLDVGPLTAALWYSIWVIWGVGGTAGLLSLSATNPVLPAGYTHKARVGWMRSDGSANKFPFAFRQFGRQVRYVVGVGTNVLAAPPMAGGVLGNPAGGAWVAVSVDPFIPVTASAIDLFVFSQTAGAYYMVADTSSYGTYLSTTNPPPISSGASTSSSAVDFWRSMSRLLLTSGRNIYCAANATDFSIRCLGWEDNL